MRITNVRHTCPDIDKLIKYIDSWNGEYHISEIDREYLIDTLEELRSSNSELRDVAHTYYHDIQDLPKNHYLFDLQRWCNRPQLFHACTFNEYIKKVI